MAHEIDVPQYFICPISLQIMKDPVTAVTGITYDRDSLEQWLSTATDAICPVSKQRLPKDSVLIPNHTLRRLIQSWCLSNSVDRVPTPKSPLDKTQVFKLVEDVGNPRVIRIALKKLEALATEDERNGRCLVEAGVAKSMALLIIKCFKEGTLTFLEESLRILRLFSISTMDDCDTKLSIIGDDLEFINSLTWVLNLGVENRVKLVNEAMPVLRKAIRVASSNLLGRLNPQFFKAIVEVLRNRGLSQQAIKSALEILIGTCPFGSNRMKIVEAGAVFELIELELEKPEKNMTELVFTILAHLCACADGREQLLKHSGSIPVISKRILRVSPATDDRAVHILALITKFSASNEVVPEMLSVGAVTKLCMVMQADSASYLKEKARGILRLHSNAWNNSPCIAIYLLTRYQR